MKQSFYLGLVAAFSFFLFALSSGIHWIVYTPQFNDYSRQHLVNFDEIEKRFHRASDNSAAFVEQRYAAILIYLSQTSQTGWRTQLIDEKRFLTRKERGHLLEVKRLLYTLNQLIYVFLLIALVVSIFYFWRTAWTIVDLRRLLKIFSWTLVIGFILLSALSPVFLPFFALLHELLFTPGTWLFSPNHLIIHLFPLDYFLLGYALIAIYVFVWALVFWGISLFLANWVARMKRA